MPIVVDNGAMWPHYQYLAKTFIDFPSSSILDLIIRFLSFSILNSSELKLLFGKVGLCIFLKIFS